MLKHDLFVESDRRARAAVEVELALVHVRYQPVHRLGGDEAGAGSSKGVRHTLDNRMDEPVK